MATTYTPLDANDATRFIANYRNASEATIGMKFGQKVKDHHNTKKTKFNESFRTFSLSFDPTRTNLQGQQGLRLVIRDYPVNIPSFTGTTANRYRIYLGLRADNTRIDILSLAKFDGGRLTDIGTYFEMAPQANIDYNAIVASAEGWDNRRTSIADMSDNTGGYSWHCDPHCP